MNIFHNLNCCKLAYNKILQNFWLTLEIFFKGNTMTFPSSIFEFFLQNNDENNYLNKIKFWKLRSWTEIMILSWN